MFLSGLLPRPMCSDDDQKLLDFGIGFTNIVERTTRGSASLSRQEIVEGTADRGFESPPGCKVLGHYMLHCCCL
jgi:hypothetical protein